MLARDPAAPGKTRLLATDDEAAHALRRALLLDSLDAVSQVGWPVLVFVTAAGAGDAVRRLVIADPGLAPHARRITIASQIEGDLAARMTHAMTATLAAGYDAVVLVGSDAPDLPPAVVGEAVDALQDDEGGRRIVLGPAADGGFYLVAARVAPAAAFEGVMWSRDDVLVEVTARATAAGFEVVLGRPWQDVDTAADLRALAGRATPGARRTRATLAAVTGGPATLSAS
jgi:rSAM/selenodomain-associated transferase 1